MLELILDMKDINALRDTNLHARLAVYINELILNRFGELVNLLYRIDVSEQKLRTLLKENSSGNAGDLIATLIIERQIQKLKFRQEQGRNTNTSDEESW